MKPEKSYRRKLPHLRVPGAIYFLTWRVLSGVAPLADEERELIVGALKFFDDKRYKLLAYVVMDDHVHVVVHPHEGEWLQKIVHSWKSFTAKKINERRRRSGSVWLSEYMDHVIRDDTELINKINYVLRNPRERWPACVDYRWVGRAA